MSTDRRQQIQAIFEEAISLPADEQEAYLAEVCKNDAKLLAEVQSLLNHDRDAPADFMQPLGPTPAFTLPEPMDDDGPDPRLGTHIGGYLIESVIAKGGMGTVYEAVQAEPRRTVALKILRRNVASRSALRRFQFESQILARLRHPAIAQVYVAGMHDSGDGEGKTPYFVMELVPGARTIVEYADDEKLSNRDRLTLFAQVCDGVHHGHQKGIIHRDLKPGNILIDEQGRPKIIDFGVARSTDSDIAVTTMQTDVGQIIGTLQYMSPEQCDADPHEIDTRSDVYSLGVVLYELLCGRLPYDLTRSTVFQAAQTIRGQPPAPPSTINRKLRGDVGTIALKALEKDRENRYGSAADLAQDIRRHLKGEPIEARPPGVWMKVYRWVGRRPILASTTASLGIALVIIVMTIVAVWIVNDRPHALTRHRAGKLVKAGDRESVDEARLLAYNERKLHVWGGPAGSIGSAAVTNRPSPFGGGKAAVVGYRDQMTGPLRGTLCIYDLDGDLDVPVRSLRVKTDDLPSSLKGERAMTGGHFTVWVAELVDVFDDANHPGDEIVAVFFNSQSQRVIRIYDLAGTLLYQVWHDGYLSPPYWMAKAGLLVFSGDNARFNWDSAGESRGATPNPLVVFAIRPQAGYSGEEATYLKCEPENGPAHAVWYKALCLDRKEVRQLSGIGITELSAPIAHDAGSFVRLGALIGPDPGAQVTWTVDENGNEVLNSRAWNDAYKLDQASGNPQLSNPKLFQLLDFKPPHPTSQPTTPPQ